MAIQLILDYFNQLDKTARKPYQAFIGSTGYYLGFKGLAYHGLYIKDGIVIVYEFPIQNWITLCNLADPNSLEKIRSYIDKARGLHG